MLGFVWLGGWWTFTLAAVAAVVALHELYGVLRPLRPLVLAGFAGALAALLGAQLGGLDWMLAGFLSTLALAFLLKGISETRQSLTVAVAATVLGVAWVALGLGHVLLIRDLPDDGRSAALTVVLTVFAADTAAYLVGRLLGRHKLAPTLSPGKTWEGLVAGTIVAILVPFFALYDWRSIVIGVTIAVATPVGDLFESALKRDMGVKDSGRVLAGHGGMLDRVDALLFASVASYYVIRALGGT